MSVPKRADAPAHGITGQRAWERLRPKTSTESGVSLAGIHLASMSAACEVASPATVCLVEIRGCDFCRDDPNLLFGRVEQVSSNEATGILLRCPYCQCLYLDPADGITRPYPVDNADAARWMDWSPDDVLSAVRTTLSRTGDDSGWTFESADLEGDKVLVVFPH
jgi:hypothetical protein